MKTPLSWKNLTTVAYVLIAVPPLRDSFGLAAGLGRRRLLLRQQGMVVNLALEHLAVYRRKRLVEDAARRAADQLARQRLLPRDDVQHLRQLAVAENLGALEVRAVRGERGRGERGEQRNRSEVRAHPPLPPF